MGCVGYALDMTSQKDEVFELVQERVKTGGSFQDRQY